MVSYRISPAVAQDVAQELDVATRRLATSLEYLQKGVQGFSQANSGQTLEAFTTAQHTWTQGHNEMSQALVQLQQRLQEIVHTYVATDTKGAAVFGGS